jgi:hypothetical protein
VGGFRNTAMGAEALAVNNESFNTAVGALALSATTVSEFNTAVGYGAASAHNLGYNNTLIGANSDANAIGLYNCVALGQGTTCTASSQARIGNSATSSIGGYVGWSNISDGRFKKNIQENVKGLDFIMKLHPVTYQLDVQGISSFLNEGRRQSSNAMMTQSISEKEKMYFSGFIAQDVESTAKQLGYDFSGVDAPKNDKDLYSLRYAEFVVPLTKAVQEQQALIDAQNETIISLEKRLQLLETQMKTIMVAK